MLRENDFGRRVPLRGAAMAQLILPLWLAGAVPVQAADWATTLRTIGEMLGRGAGSEDISAQAASETALSRAALDLPLPPYPPPVFGLEGPSHPKYGKAVAPVAAPQAPPSSGKPVPPPLPPVAAAEAQKLVPPPLPPAAAPDAQKPVPPPLPSVTAPPPSEIMPPAQPASVAPELPMPDIMRAAFAKASASPLFPRLLKPEREAISSYYEAHGFKPLWHAEAGGALTPAGRAVLDRMAHAAEEGLDADDYAAAATPAASARLEDVAEAEWRVSAAALAYARDARGARVNPSRLSVLITPELHLPSADQVFDAVTGAEDASSALEAFNPHADGYLNLRVALAKLRAETIVPSPAKSQAPAGVQLASVAPEVLKGRGKGQGVATRHALPAVSAKRVEADIIANMERWRWLPPDLGDRYILVNVPEFTLRYIDNGALAHVARVVVGKPTSPTPIFSGEMKFLVVNPSWYIPPSILKKEFLPKLAEDPLYAERQGYVVVRKGGQISIRQPPGERNALGRIKFMFPNRHSVYLHDTPSRSLFAKTERAFSHGCVRVDQPLKLAEYVLNNKSVWPEKRIEKLIGGDEKTISLSRQLPVHLAYFTLSADPDGLLHRFGDIYGLDSRLHAALTPLPK
jgi:murein L,D-transpeptidase YcbB/YkuD